MDYNSLALEPTRTILISGFRSFEELERFRESTFNPETMSQHFCVAQSNILFFLFFDVRDAAKFISRNENPNLNLSFTISKFELPKKNEECSEKNWQSTVIFEFVGLDIKLEDNFFVNLLKQYGDIKELKGSSHCMKVIEFYSIKDAKKAFKALDGSPFANGEIKCRWDWDMLTSTRMAYIKMTDQLIKDSMNKKDNSDLINQENEINSGELNKRIKTENKNESETEYDGKNLFIELFDQFISNNISEIEYLFN